MKFLILRAASLCLAAWLAALPAFAFDLDVREYKLANGLDLVVVPDHGSEVLTHMVFYKVGAADEPKGKSGIAHFLEHLMFKGTPKYPTGKFSRLIRINGGEENAFTTQDYTGYFQYIAKNRLELVMELEADRMQNLTLTEENVLPELKVVEEERRQRIENNPSSLLGEKMDAAMYSAHPYGKPVIGWMPEVSKLTLNDALDFYRAHYEPANAIVVVAGDVAPENVKHLAEKYYGGLKNPFPPEARVRAEEPPSTAARRIVMKDQRTTTAIWQRSYLAPAAAKVMPSESLALEVLADILGGGSQSRLYQTLVVEKKLAAYAGAAYSEDALDYGSFVVYAAPNTGIGVEQLESAVEEVIASLLRNGVTAEELDRARNRRVSDAVYLLDQQQALARMFGVALATGQKVKDVLNWDHDIEKLVPEDVKRAAASVLDEKASVTGILLPENGIATAGAPAEPQLPSTSEN